MENQKAQILPDEKTTSTKLEIMSSLKASIWIIIVSVFVTIAAVCSFVPRNTNYRISRTASEPVPKAEVTNRQKYQNFTPLNSFAILSVIPFVKEKVSKVTLNVSGKARLHDSAMNVISERSISVVEEVKCQKSVCNEIIATSYNFAKFYAVSLVATVSTTNGQELLRRAEFTCTSLNTPISYTFFILISGMTLVVILILAFVVPKRLYPTRSDHWSTIFLGLACLCIDGPWLVLKYYSAYWFSNIYDIMPELFHMYFIFFVMSFFFTQTHTWATRIFGSYLIHIAVSFGLLLIIILQSIEFDKMPLNTGSVFIQKSNLKIPIYALTIVYHALILFIMILGIITVQIKEDAVLVLVGLTIILVEILDIIRAILRFNCPRNQLGFTFAADVFYILYANFFTAFYLYYNLPVAKSIDVERKQEAKQTEIAEIDPSEIVNEAEDEEAAQENTNNEIQENPI